MGIYVAAAITSVLAAAAIGGMLFWKTSSAGRPVLSRAIALELPMCALAFYLVRVPLQEGWQHLVGDGAFFGFLTTFSAPLTEEPAKLWPLLIPTIRRWVSKEHDVRLAVALGLGFGVGEMWFVAQLVARGNPEIAALPWYQLGGFINERFMVCVMHGAFTATALRFGPVRGFLGALALHYIGNFPIYLSKIDAAGLGEATWKTILTLWVPGYFLAMLTWLVHLSAGNWRLGEFLYGTAKCPECEQVYPRPLLGLNLGTKRYERCPHCRRWHLL